MRKLRSWVIGLCIGSVAVTILLLLLSPDLVPVHYDVKGAVDRMGSKYEYLLFPCLSILLSAVFYGIAVRCQEQSLEKAILVTAICVLVLLGIIGTWFQILGIVYASEKEIVLVDNVVQMLFFTLGISYLLVGNILPKTRRNAVFGLRTTWSMASDMVWQKSQRFAGYTMILCGLLTMGCCLIEDAIACIFSCTVLTLLWCIVGSGMSYRYYQKEQKEKM